MLLEVQFNSAILCCHVAQILKADLYMITDTKFAWFQRRKTMTILTKLFKILAGRPSCLHLHNQVHQYSVPTKMPVCVWQRMNRRRPHLTASKGLSQSRSRVWKDSRETSWSESEVIFDPEVWALETMEAPSSKSMSSSPFSSIEGGVTLLGRNLCRRVWSAGRWIWSGRGTTGRSPQRPWRGGTI